MEDVWGAVKLMLFVYGLGAVVSFLVAWVMKLIFAAVRMRSASQLRGEEAAKTPVAAKAPLEPVSAAPERKA